MSDQLLAPHTTIDQSGQTVYGPQTNIAASIHLTRLDPTDRRNQRNHAVLRQAVRRFWIEGVLHSSLYNAVLIRLGLDARPDAVDNRPWDLILQQAGQPDQRIADDKSLVEIFDDMYQQLLILGEPGSGKTTTLLALADGLLTRTAADPTLPTPVVFNLSSWVEKQLKLEDWLVEELNTRYQIPRKVAQSWVANDELLLLLDGLDEVAETKRAACVDAINTFRQEHIVALSVCSRTAEYTALTTRLKLVGAVVIHPLTPEQIEVYITRVGSHAVPLRHALAKSAELHDLAHNPLMLSIMALAYHDQAATDTPPNPATRSERQSIFDRYLAHMFQHRVSSHTYPPAQTLHWLCWLANQMATRSQSIFLIERLQSDWLGGQRVRYLYRLLVALLSGLSAQPIFGMRGGLLFGLLGGLLGAQGINVKSYAILTFSWKKGIRDGIIIGGLFGLLAGFFSSPIVGFIVTPYMALLMSLLFGIQPVEAQLTVQPNQGIWRSLKNGLLIGLLVSLISCMGGLLVYKLAGVWNLELPTILFTIVVIGMSFGLFDCMKHLLLRIMLRYNNSIPWNYARFLDYAASRLFLRKVGGGYVFVHRLLLEHFASLTDEDIARITTGVKSA